MKQAGKQRNEGFVLVVALLIVGIVAVMVAGSLVLSITNQRINRNDALTSQVLNVAQGGNAYWKAELVSLYQYMVENFEDYADEINKYEEETGPISCGNYFAIGLDLDRNGTIEIPNNPRDPSSLPTVSIPIGSSKGDATVRFSVSGSSIRLEGRGELHDAKSTIIEEFNISNVDIWNNAVFAESGAANTVIKGRAEIRGAVHMLGTGLTKDDEALDLSGNFGMGNTYRGLNSSLNVTSQEMRLSNDDPLDLCATLRVRSGYVNLTGSGTIGYPESTNGTENGYEIIDNLHGVYTNHGIKGGRDATKESETKPNVFSKNGMTTKYDAGDSFVFPSLDSKIPDPNPDNLTWAKQLQNNSLVIDMRGVNVAASLDDRKKFPNKEPGSKNGKTYQLRGDCGESTAGGTNHFMFGVDHDPAVNPVLIPNGALSGTSLTPLIQPGLTLASIVYPNVTRSLLPALGSLATHKSGHKDKDETVVDVVPTNTFTLEWNQTPDFDCTKVEVGGGANGNDKIIGEVRWERSSSTLYVNGAVTLLGGNLHITGKGGGNREIVYKGNGVIFVEKVDLSGGQSAGGNVIAEIDFLPGTGKVPVTNSNGRLGSGNLYPTDSSLDDNLYPNTALMGIVARNKFVSQGSQNRYTFALYAENGVRITQQTLVAGAIVTRSFDAGKNVPTVLYVPNLSERLSDMMPGAGGNGFAVSNVAWSRSY